MATPSVPSSETKQAEQGGRRGPICTTHYVRTSQISTGHHEFAYMTATRLSSSPDIAMVLAKVGPFKGALQAFPRPPLAIPSVHPLLWQASTLITPNDEMEKITRVFLNVVLPYPISQFNLSINGIGELCRKVFPQLDQTISFAVVTDGHRTEFYPQIFFQRTALPLDVPVQSA